MPDAPGARAVGADHPDPALAWGRARGRPAARRWRRSRRRRSWAARARRARPARPPSRRRRAARGRARRWPCRPPGRGRPRRASAPGAPPRSSSSPVRAGLAQAPDLLAAAGGRSRCHASWAWSAVRSRSRRTRRSSQSTRPGEAIPGVRRYASRSSASPRPDRGAQQREQPRAGQRSGSRAGPPGPRPGSGSGRTRGAAAGPSRRGRGRRPRSRPAGTSPSSSRATSEPIVSASASSPAEASSARPPSFSIGLAAAARRSGARARTGSGCAVKRGFVSRCVIETPRHVPQLGEEGAAGRGQHLAVLVGEGEGHVGGIPELADQLDLLGGEVVEAVEQDRAACPAVGMRAQGRGRRGGEAVGVLAPQLVAELAEGLRRATRPPLVGAGLGGALAQGRRVDRRRPAARRSAPPAPRRSRAAAPKRPDAQARRGTLPRRRAAGAARR